MVNCGVYELGRVLGKGTYGCVYECVNDKGLKFAIKKLLFSIKYEAIFLFFREISILKNLNHPHIVDLRDIVLDDSSSVGNTSCVYLVMDLFDSDLRHYVKKNFVNRIVPIEILREWILKICSAVEYLHINEIMHRDLKPQNILINAASGVLKIADFGLCKYVRGIGGGKCALTHEIVTLWYRAPEIILGAPLYDKSIDMWSIGVMISEMCSGINPFNGRNEIDTLMKIFQKIGTPTYLEVYTYINFSHKFPKWDESKSFANWRDSTPTNTPLWITDILNKLLRNNPKERMTATQLLKHDF